VQRCWLHIRLFDNGNPSYIISCYDLNARVPASHGLVSSDNLRGKFFPLGILAPVASVACLARAHYHWLFPGWEDHHAHRHAQDRSELPSADVQVVSSGKNTKIISLYQSLVGDGTVLSFGMQLLWLTEWPTLSEFSPLVRPLEMVSLTLASAWLPPPDRPPTPLFNKS